MRLLLFVLGLSCLLLIKVHSFIPKNTLLGIFRRKYSIFSQQNQVQCQQLDLKVLRLSRDTDNVILNFEKQISERIAKNRIIRWYVASFDGDDAIVEVVYRKH